MKLIPRSTFPGGVTPEEVHSLNGIGMIFDRSGHYVDPLRWRNGIQGIGDLETYPGSGGSDALLRNPIHPSLGCTQGLGEPLTPGLHGLMSYPGSGGSDVLVRNPIHPSNSHAWLVGNLDLGGKNKLADSMQSAPGVTADGKSSTTAISSDWATLASALGIPGLAGITSRGLGCGCGCGGRGGCGDSASNLSGLGDDTTDTTDTGPTTLETLFLNTGLDFTIDGSLIGGIPNWALYGGMALLVATTLLPSPVSSSGRRKR